MAMDHPFATRSGRVCAAATIATLLVGTTACGSSSKKAKAKESASPSATASASASASAPTAGPAPSVSASAKKSVPTKPPGSLKTVPPVAVRTQAAVPPTGTGNFGDGVTVKIVKVQNVKSQGTGPGEISGAPSLALTMNLVNG